MDQQTNFAQVMQERFSKLPPSVQAAITSAEVETHLRELAKTNQLHLDQWNLLENEVMLTLLGLQESSQLKDNIIKEVGVSEDIATKLATDIAEHVFQPIREELERQLEHPAAQVAQVSDVEAVRTEALKDTDPASTTTTEAVPETPTPSPAATPAPTSTPTPATNNEKVARPEPSTSYHAKVPSHERKTIEGDPYREQVA